MKITQIYEIVNDSTKNILGENATPLAEDLSNIVDVGNEIINTDNLDNYVKALVNHIGKVKFDNRKYSGGVPSVLMDSWEFGSILEKITAELPEATENESWQLEDGKEYSQDIFYQPKVSAKFFNSQVTFEIPLSFTERQVKESFSNATQLNGFISMLVNAVDKSMTVKIDSLVMKTINNMTAETIFKELATEGGQVSKTKTTTRAVNLLKLYKDKTGEELTKEAAIYNKDFIKFVSYQMNLYADRMKKISTLFNMGKKAKFTPTDKLHVILLSEFANATDTYLKADTKHNDLVSLPNFDTIPYWQGTGDNYDFNNTSAINVKTNEGNTVKTDGIVGVMFDTEALGVANMNRRVTTNYNAKAEFYTNFYKMDAGYFNDFNENFIVFLIA